MTALLARWRRLSLPARVIVALIVAAVALNLGLEVLLRATGGSGPGGPMSSSYATGPDGLAAYADLLQRAGHPITQLRQPLDTADLPADGTIVVAGAVVTNTELDAVQRYVEGGGRLVAAGVETASALRRLLGTDLTWRAIAVDVAHPLAPAPETAGVVQVRAAAGGSWGDPAGTLPVLGGGGRVLASVATLGAGRVVLLADPSPLQNRLLDKDDNAAFGLSAAGPTTAGVVFAEAGHGYTRASGIRALPRQWKVALAVAVLAAAMWMWSASRRLGPPQDDARPLPPPRRAYVDAVAATLAKTGDSRTSMQPLRQAAVDLLRRRSPGRGQLGDDDMEQAARQLGLAPDEIAALMGSDDPMALGRAMARLQREATVETARTRW